MSLAGALGVAVGLFGKKLAQTTSVPAVLPIRVSDFHDSLEGRAEAATTALATLAQPSDIGRPFGPGFGLEETRGWLLQIFKSQSELQAVGHVAGDTLISAVRSKKVSFESIDDMLGIDEAAARKFGLSRRQQSILIETVYHSAKEVLIQMSKEDMVGLKRWFGDMPFMAEVLAYHQLAISRHRAAGLL